MKQSVLALIQNPEKTKVLLVKRRDVPVWVLPGGGVELNESLEAAIVREILEETGLESKIDQKLTHYTPLNRLSGEVHLFACTPISGEIKTTEETREIAYFSPSALPKKFFYIHQEMLKEALEKKERPITKKLTQVTWINFFRYFLLHPLLTGRFLLSKIGLPINDR